MKKLVSLLVVIPLALSACSKTDANKRNFANAITKHLNVNGRLCLGHYTWPVDVSEKAALRQDDIANEMQALQAVGLLNATEMDSPGFFSFGKITRYNLSDAGKAYAYESTTGMLLWESANSELCWGQRELDKIVKWEGPIRFGDYQEARVIYTYKIIGLADWAENAQVQAAFPIIKETVAGAGHQEMMQGVKLTAEGWQPKY